MIIYMVIWLRFDVLFQNQTSLEYERNQSIKKTMKYEFQNDRITYVRNFDGSTQVPPRACNNARRSIWCLPPRVKARKVAI